MEARNLFPALLRLNPPSRGPQAEESEWPRRQIKQLALNRCPVPVFAYYNFFCRIHQTLRVTPAMAAGVTDRIWNLSELLVD